MSDSQRRQNSSIAGTSLDRCTSYYDCPSPYLFARHKSMEGRYARGLGKQRIEEGPRQTNLILRCRCSGNDLTDSRHKVTLVHHSHDIDVFQKTLRSAEHASPVGIADYHASKSHEQRWIGWVKFDKTADDALSNPNGNESTT